MYILYLDESGQHGGDYFVLGGAALFERKPHWLAKELDQIEQEYLSDYEIDLPVELHASPIRDGEDNEPWDQIPQNDRYELLNKVYRTIGESKAVLFGVAIERDWLDGDKSEYLFAFESILKRFDDFLVRLDREEGNTQRGLVVIAESSYRRRIEELSIKIKDEGTRWGDLYNLAEIPLFTNSANTRLLQVADFCSNAIYGRYEGGHARQFDRIADSFFEEEGVISGLAHFTNNHEKCTCPACLSRRN